MSHHAAAELEAGQLDREKLSPLLRRGDEVGDLGLEGGSLADPAAAAARWRPICPAWRMRA